MTGAYLPPYNVEIRGSDKLFWKDPIDSQEYIKKNLRSLLQKLKLIYRQLVRLTDMCHDVIDIFKAHQNLIL